jgi:hypothetical protein
MRCRSMMFVFSISNPSRLGLEFWTGSLLSSQFTTFDSSSESACGVSLFFRLPSMFRTWNFRSVSMRSTDPIQLDSSRSGSQIIPFPSSGRSTSMYDYSHALHRSSPIPLLLVVTAYAVCVAHLFARGGVVHTWERDRVGARAYCTWESTTSRHICTPAHARIHPSACA